MSLAVARTLVLFLLLASPVLSAFISIAKPTKCIVSPDVVNLTRIVIQQLPESHRLQLHRITPFDTPNSTWILDTYYPMEHSILQLSLLKLTDRVAIISTRCPSTTGSDYCTNYMLGQSQYGKTLWIKQVSAQEQRFTGFVHWKRTFLYEDPAHQKLILQVCNFRPLWLALTNDSQPPDASLLRCSNLDTDGFFRSQNCNPKVNFGKLAQRVHRGSVSYQNVVIRRFVVTLGIVLGCSCAFLISVNNLLKMVVK